jgi:hypothetical protein
MILRAKFLLIWLLALALPVQGFAAALQSACAQQAAMTHEVSAQASMAAMDHSMHGMHEVNGMHEMHHADAAADAGSKSASPSSSHQTSHDASHSSCSSCAVCSVGAVLPLADSIMPSPDFPAGEYLTLPAQGFVGYTPENPERPPSLLG